MYNKNNYIKIISKEKERKHIYDLKKYNIRFRKSKEKDLDNKILNK